MKVAMENVQLRLRSDGDTLHSKMGERATSITPGEAPKVSEAELEVMGKAIRSQRQPLHLLRSLRNFRLGGSLSGRQLFQGVQLLGTKLAGHFELSAKLIDCSLHRVSLFFNIDERLHQSEFVFRMVRIVSGRGISQKLILASLQGFVCGSVKSLLFFESQASLSQL